MAETYQQFTRIKGRYSEARRLPRLGKIRLGIKKRSQKGVEYPSETNHFVVPPEVAEVYGEAPTELDVMLPVEDPEIFFPQKLARYSKTGGLQCHGDKETALERIKDTAEFQPRTCPCEALEKGDCKEVSHLMVILPKVSMGGVYQITTSSKNSTMDVNSAIDYTKALIKRVSMVPLKLRRVPMETMYQGKKATHYSLSLIPDYTSKEVQALRDGSEDMLLLPHTIEAPNEDGPFVDPPDVVGAEEPPEEVMTVPAYIGGIGGKRLDDPEISALQLDALKNHVKKKNPEMLAAIEEEMKRRAQGHEKSDESDAVHDYANKIQLAESTRELTDLKDNIHLDTTVPDNEKVLLLTQANAKLRDMGA